MTVDFNRLVSWRVDFNRPVSWQLDFNRPVSCIGSPLGRSHPLRGNTPSRTSCGVGQLVSWQLDFNRPAQPLLIVFLPRYSPLSSRLTALACDATRVTCFL